MIKTGRHCSIRVVIMSYERVASLSAIKRKMVVISLLGAAVASGGVVAAGSGAIPAIAGIFATALFSSLACAGILEKAVAVARLEQLAIVERLGLADELTGYVDDNDDLASLASRSAHIMEKLGGRLSGHQRLLARIMEAEGGLRALLQGQTSSDEEELAQARDA